VTTLDPLKLQRGVGAIFKLATTEFEAKAMAYASEATEQVGRNELLDETEIPTDEYEEMVSRIITTQPATRRVSCFAPVPEKNKDGNLGL
jgi:hypothetical protein